MSEKSKIKMVIGVTGASGSVYAKLLFAKLQNIKDQWERIDIVFSKNAEDVWKYELGNESFKDLPYKTYSPNDFFAPTASGSAGYDGMIIVPCSMGTLGRIASGTSDDLLIRSADVMLKERKKLILVTREMPFNLIHIKNMETVTLAGGIICPASPSFYLKQKSTEEILSTVVDRALQLAGFDIDSKEWGNIVEP